MSAAALRQYFVASSLIFENSPITVFLHYSLLTRNKRQILILIILIKEKYIDNKNKLTTGQDFGGEVIGDLQVR